MVPGKTRESTFESEKYPHGKKKLKKLATYGNIPLDTAHTIDVVQLQYCKGVSALT